MAQASSTRRIDVHHHVIPPAFVDVMQRRGIGKVAGAPLPGWSPADSIRVMDQYDIQTAITSVSAPGVYFGSLPEAVALARRCNEFSAEMAVQYPGRFGSFAVLPMPFTEQACAEAVYALDVLKADGIVLLGSTEGKFLGDPAFDELMAELDRRRVTVFVHPNLHASSETLGLNMPGFLMEFLCDTTRAACNLVLGGTLERYPGIRWILAHAGGFLPYIAWRLSLANMMAPYDQTAPQGILTYIRRFYFDTALSPSPWALAALEALVEPSHILFGSDFPFAPDVVTGMQHRAIRGLVEAGPATRRALERANALALFPAYAQAGEVPAALPVYGKEAFSGRLRRAMASPLVSMAERMRQR